MYYIGIDIGSTAAKIAVVDEGKQIVYTEVRPTGWSSAETAAAIQKDLTEKGYLPDAKVVATGYGRVSVPYADKVVTEITCHGKGAAHIFGTGQCTVIDIGGQDTKVVTMENGMVKDFMMNDKCSAGTGRFLEIMANALGLDIPSLCSLARQGGGVSISSMCTVFAESEVISLIGSGREKADIAYGIVESITSKVASLCGKHSVGCGTLCLTGGLCETPYIIESLGNKLGQPITSVPLARYAGAVGAALALIKS